MNPTPHLALTPTVLPPAAPGPCLQGGDGSFWGQWVLAAPAELFYLISSLLLPRSESSFRASGMPLGVPQAVGESLLCLLWDGSLSFCQETGSQQLARGNRFPMQVPGVPVKGLGAAAIPAVLWAAWYCGSSPMALVCLHGLSRGTGRAFIQRSDGRGGKSKFASEMKPQGQLT